LTSCLILEAIAIERLIAVVCPLRHHTLSTTRNACGIILGCLGYAIVIGAMPLAGWNVVDDTDAPINASIVARTTLNGTTIHPLSSFGDCRFDTVVGASYVAFLYPPHQKSTMLEPWFGGMVHPWLTMVKEYGHDDFGMVQPYGQPWLTMINHS